MGIALAPPAGVGPAGETVETSITVPRKTTSPCCKPGHTPGVAFEQVHASAAAGIMTNTQISATAHRLMTNILQSFCRNAKAAKERVQGTIWDELAVHARDLSIVN
jgi:hypothetical protein